MSRYFLLAAEFALYLIGIAAISSLPAITVALIWMDGMSAAVRENLTNTSPLLFMTGALAIAAGAAFTSTRKAG